MATNQVNFPSIGLNNTNASKTNGKENIIAVARKTSNRRNAVAVKYDLRNERARDSKRGIDSAIKNKEVGTPNKDAKVDLEIQLKRDIKISSEV